VREAGDKSTGRGSEESTMQIRTLMMTVAAAAMLFAGAEPAGAGWRERYMVHGVGPDDMLKLRAGPGTGYVVVLGLPNGTVLRVKDCTQTGGTRWCEVALDAAPAMEGFVSRAYLRPL
jgi:uncharacterized protein YraI